MDTNADTFFVESLQEMFTGYLVEKVKKIKIAGSGRFLLLCGHKRVVRYRA